MSHSGSWVKGLVPRVVLLGRGENLRKVEQVKGPHIMWDMPSEGCSCERVVMKA